MKEKLLAELNRRLNHVKSQTSASSDREEGYMYGQEAELESLLDWVANSL